MICSQIIIVQSTISDAVTSWNIWWAACVLNHNLIRTTRTLFLVQVKIFLIRYIISINWVVNYSIFTRICCLDLQITINIVLKMKTQRVNSLENCLNFYQNRRTSTYLRVNGYFLLWLAPHKANCLLLVLTFFKINLISSHKNILVGYWVKVIPNLSFTCLV